MERSKAEPSRFATPVVAGFVPDENAGLPRAGFRTTVFTGSTDTSDEHCVSGVRTSTDFFGWAQPLIDDIGASDAIWNASIAFSGIGCPELAASALNHGLGRDCFCFVHGIERDHVARIMLSSHAPTTHVQTDILSVAFTDDAGEDQND